MTVKILKRKINELKNGHSACIRRTRLLSLLRQYDYDSAGKISSGWKPKANPEPGEEAYIPWRRPYGVGAARIAVDLLTILSFVLFLVSASLESKLFLAIFVALFVACLLFIYSSSPDDSFEKYWICKGFFFIMMMLQLLFSVAAFIFLALAVRSLSNASQDDLRKVVDDNIAVGFILVLIYTIVCAWLMYRGTKHISWPWISPRIMFSVDWLIKAGIGSSVLVVVDVALVSWCLTVMKDKGVGWYAPGWVNSLLQGAPILVGVVLSLAASYAFSLVKTRRDSLGRLREAADDCIVVISQEGPLDYARLMQCAMNMDRVLSGNLLARINSRDPLAGIPVRLMLMACFSRIACSYRSVPALGSGSCVRGKGADELPCFPRGCVLSDYAKGLYAGLRDDKVERGMRESLRALGLLTVPELIDTTVQFLLAVRKAAEA